jgi:hypothetical protein
METYSSEKLQLLLNSAPDDFLGLSTISGDAECLNAALALVSDSQRALLILVMESGGKLHAAKTIGKIDFAKIMEASKNITSALKELRRKFDVAAETYVPTE